MTAITVTDLTQATLEGSGIFDVLMRANKAHLDAEFKKGTLKGPEYSTVYLGSLEAVLRTAFEFLVSKQKVDLEAQLLQKQIAQADAQIALINQQKANLVDELLTAALQRDKVTQEVENLAAQKLHTEAQTALVNQQKANAIIEGTVLTAQKCKLDAEYDVLLQTVIKTTAESNLLTQKIATEKAQILSVGVDADSVVGRQKALYLGQSEGFKRDAEQKAAKIMIDTWATRRMTDEATSANTTNKLDDTAVGRVVDKLLTGVSA